VLAGLDQAIRAAVPPPHTHTHKNHNFGPRGRGLPPVSTSDEAWVGTAGDLRAHIGIDGHYSFHLPDLGGTHRPLRDPDADDE